MKTLLSISIAAVLLCATASAAEDISGKWVGYPGYMIIQQEGAKVTGTIGQSATEQFPFENGVLDGDRISFKMGLFQADLRIEGAEIKGTMSNGSQTVKVFLKRAEAEGAVPRAFDAASVKHAPPSFGGTNSSMKADPGRITCTNLTLKRLIVFAYSLKDYQVSGPDWLDSERYDIVATMPVSLPMDRVQAMMQPLLAERFKLVLHRESKELPVYGLVPEKSGLKLQPAEGFPSTRINGGPKGRHLTGNMSLVRLAEALSGSLERPVLDMTGAKGMFAIDMEWVPDDTQAGPKKEGAEAPDGQSIYSALKQLGLKLEARKAPIDILVVDHAEKTPIEN